MDAEDGGQSPGAGGGAVAAGGAGGDAYGRTYIGVAERLDPCWRRWVIAHAIGHRLLHPGNHLWIRDHSSLGGGRYEREAEDFALALLVDTGGEAREEGLRELWEVADHFGVPQELVVFQPPLVIE